MEHDRSDGHGRGFDARSPTDISGQGWKAVLRRVVGQLKEDHVSLLSAGVAFKALLALFPALIAAISIWGLVSDPATIQQQITSFTSALPDAASSIIEQQMTDVAGSGSGALSGALITSILLALWSASAGVAGLIEGCNAAYNEVDERSFFVKRGLALLFTLGAIVFLIVAIGLIAVLPPALGQLGLGSAAELSVNIARWPLLALLVMGALALIYRYGPDRATPQLRWSSAGAILATVVWLLASVGFTIYVEVAGNFAATYGALAGVIVLMLWLYLTAFSILLGAEFNAETEHETTYDTTTGPQQPVGQRNAVVADTWPEDAPGGPSGEQGRSDDGRQRRRR